jgi:hypothetical protein
MGGGSWSRSATSTGRCCWWAAADDRLGTGRLVAELAVERLQATAIPTPLEHLRIGHPETAAYSTGDWADARGPAALS